MRHQGRRCHEARGARNGWKKAEREFAKVFGPEGPFGPDGPFGEDGPFGPGGPFGGGGGRFGGRGRHRRGRMFGHGELRLALLQLLADEPRHGYELIKAIEDLTGGAYAPSPGAVYPTLQMLADEGLIEEQGDDSPRKAFAATDAGRAELADKSDDVEAIMERLGSFGEERRGSPHLHIQRAMENLRNALRMHRAQGNLHGDRLNEIVDLIDELAKKIERL
ncbi:PadR family transcriptional regulator [Tsuneonella mangrovi]|uniref:PadR family transcriptional regulator n=1 Tax=Tsuneonella mangrovi TaxID=1982042 RepID=UPI000BA1E591|nr:PadR family transcriptional regulator [Tsuneonella mangrovi]